MSILIVDDNETSASIMEINLMREHFTTVIAHSAGEALACLETLSDTQLIILDIMMPGMNGLELLSWLRKDSRWKNIPVILCTALTDSETFDRALQLGCSHYHVKPINPYTLIADVKEVLDREKSTPREDHLASHYGIDRKQIMSRYHLNGRACDRIAREFRSCIGEVIEDLEKDDTVPLSQDRLQQIFETASILGASRTMNILDWFLRAARNQQADEALLRSEYKVLLKELRLQHRALTEEKAKASSDNEIKKKLPQQIDAEKSFDRDYLLRQLKGNENHFIKVMADFLKEAHKHIKAVKKAFNQRDADAAAFHAHALKGASASAGANGLRDSAVAIEKLSEEKEFDAMEPYVQSLDRELKALCTYMEEDGGSIPHHTQKND